MTTAVAESVYRSEVPFLSEEQLAWLGCTFDEAAEAIWVRDPQDRHIYCNEPANGRCPTGSAMRLPVMDHTGQMIAYLVMEPV